MSIVLEYKKMQEDCFGNLIVKINLPHADLKGREEGYPQSDSE